MAFKQYGFSSSQFSKGEALKQLLQDSERRILQEIHKVKDELLKEVKSDLEGIRVGAGAQQERPVFSPFEVTDRSEFRLRTRSFGVKATDESDQISSFPSAATTWAPEAPHDVMDKYISLIHSERDDASVLSHDFRTLRRFVAGFRTATAEVEGEERSLLASVVASHAFDSLAAVLVMANAIFIGVDVHFTCRSHSDVPQEVDQALFIAGIVFLVVFFAEWVLRVRVFGVSFFTCHSNGCHWNWLDTISLTLQVVDEAYQIVSRNSPKSLVPARVMRLLRVVRIFRVLRLLSLSDKLGMLAHAIGRSLSTVCWALVLMVTIVYVFSVTFTERVWSITRGDEDHRLAYYFADIPRTMLTLTESVLGGLSWDEPAWLLFSEIGFPSGLMFVIFVFLGFFILCNVVTGIFNEGVSKSAEEEASRQLSIKLQLAVGMGNPDHRETQQTMFEEITWEEFRDKVLYDDHMKTYFLAINIEPTATSARKVFEYLDIDQDEVLTRGEVFYGCLKLREPARAVDVTLMRHNLSQIEQGLEYLIIGQNRLNERSPSSRRSRSGESRSRGSSDEGISMGAEISGEVVKVGESRSRVSFCASSDEGISVDAEISGG